MPQNYTSPSTSQSNQTNLIANAPIASTSTTLTQNNTLQLPTQNSLDVDVDASTNTQNASTSEDDYTDNELTQTNETTDETNDEDCKDVVPEQNAEDSSAIDAVFNSQSDGNSSSASSDSHPQIPTTLNLAPNQIAFYDRSVLKIKTTYDDDCEFVHTYGTPFKPKILAFETKLNDIISENIPFKNNVRIKLNIDQQYFQFYLSLLLIFSLVYRTTITAEHI